MSEFYWNGRPVDLDSIGDRLIDQYYADMEREEDEDETATSQHEVDESSDLTSDRDSDETATSQTETDESSDLSSGRDSDESHFERTLKRIERNAVKDAIKTL